jgi:hypothetical protein
MSVTNLPRSDSLTEENGKTVFQSDLIHKWLQTNKGTGAGVYGYGTRQKLSLSLGKYTTVFQAEVYGIKACAVDNLDRHYNNRNIYLHILSDCQAAIKAPNNYQVNSELVWDCH